MSGVIDSLVEAANAAGVSIEDLDIGSVAQTALSSINNPDGTGDEFFNMTTDASGNVTSIEYGSSSSGFGKAEGVTDQDILNGNAIAQVNPETGKYEWTILSDNPYVSDGQLYIKDEETGEYYRIDEETNERVYPETIGDTLAPNPYTPNSAPTLEDMSNPDSPAYDPEQVREEINNNNLTDALDNDSGSWTGDAAQWFLDALNSGAIYIEEAVDAVEEAGGWELDKESFMHPQNLYSILAQSMSQIPEAIGGVADSVSQEYGGAITQFAKDMATVAEGARTQEYNDAIERLDNFSANLPPATDDPNTPIEYYDEDVFDRDGNIRHRKGDYKGGDESRGASAFFHGMRNVLKTAFEDPNVFASQTIGVELPIEVFTIVAGQKIKMGAQAILGGLRSVKGLGLTDDLVSSLSTQVGLAGAALLDVGESAGATFTGTYEQAFDTKVRTRSR